MSSYHPFSLSPLLPFCIALALCAGIGAQAETVKLKWLAAGAAQKGGGGISQRLMLTPSPPDTLKKAPADLTAPLYGVLTIGPTESPTSICVVMEETQGKEARLFVDANNNGDLTDDPPLEWKKQTYKSAGQEYTSYSGGATMQVRYGAETRAVHLNLKRYDPADPAHAILKDALTYTSDYACEGEITLGGQAYKVLLADLYAKGDFRSEVSAMLLIDVNGNGVFDRRGEMFNLAQPFNIRGTTYEVKGVSASGETFEIVKSAKSVPEISPPPNLNPGRKALPFEAKTTEGQTIQFPSAYKGKLVLLYFWASWCSDCAENRPFIVKAYEKFHSRGLEILGVSLDKANSGELLATFTKQNQMPWPEIYDGKHWQAAIAQLYFAQSIPSGYLINGDTGEILAAGNDVLGEKTALTIQKALEKTKRSSARP